MGRSLHILLVSLAPFLLAHTQQLPLRTFTAKDGLIRSDVRTMCQDSSGFLWFGTSDGVCRYDGSDFVSVLLPDGPEANFINALSAGPDSSVVFATNGGGIALWKQARIDQKFVVPLTRSTRANRVNCLCRMPDGRLLLGTDDGLFVERESSFVGVPAEDFPKGMVVTAIVNDRRGNVWVGTERGLFVMDSGRSTHCEAVHEIDAVTVSAICNASGDTLWIGTEHGLRCILRRENGRGSIGTLPIPFRGLDSLFIHCLLFDSEKVLWVGTDTEGLFEFESGTLSHWTIANDLPSNKVIALLEDNERTVWISTNAGLGELSTRNVLNYTSAGKYARIYMSPIVQDRAGRIWAGSQQGMTRLERGIFKTFSVADGLLDDYVLALLADSAGTLWVGTGMGLNCLPPGAQRFHSPVEFNHLRGHTVRSLLLDKEGILWVGWNKGISGLLHGFVSNFVFPDSVRSPRVVGLVRDEKGFLWVGTEGSGLYKLSIHRAPGNRMSFTLAASSAGTGTLTEENVRSLMDDGNGRLWVGTRTGGLDIISLRSEVITRLAQISVGSGISGNWVRASMKDRHGNIWIATNRGVDILGVDSLSKPTLRTDLLEIAGDDAYALCEDRNGSVWVGASNGMTRISPNIGGSGLKPPPIYITRFQVFGVDNPSALREGIAQLDPDQHSIAFEFVGLTYVGHNAVRYRYVLEGLDTAWSAPTKRRYVNFTHLPPGRYNFRVVAGNAEGLWSVPPATFSFTIAEPLWAHWWFITAVGLLLSAALYRLHILRVGRLLEMERVRNSIAADLHDDIGSTLSSITVFSRMAEEETTKDALEAAKILRRIGSSAQAMLESLDEIVWMVKPGNDMVDRIAIRIRDHARQVCEAADIRFAMELPQDIQELRMSLEDRRQLYLIVKEAINNIVKHASCANVTVVLRAHEKELELLIQDDGRGFVESELQNGNGLDNMRQRAALMKGHLLLESVPGSGTSILMKAKLT